MLLKNNNNKMLSKNGNPLSICSKAKIKNLFRNSYKQNKVWLGTRSWKCSNLFWNNI